MYAAHTGIGGARTQSSQLVQNLFLSTIQHLSPHVAEQDINVILKGVTGRSHHLKAMYFIKLSVI